ncbi:hypothetical protein GE09DRAFT_154440 [Coniochaeta sp. 2T2.1]|nr:hypothetical protein GE09DRAFT_154440 [Coniochaeta sp. 2T2.1]
MSMSFGGSEGSHGLTVSLFLHGPPPMDCHVQGCHRNCVADLVDDHLRQCSSGFPYLLLLQPSTYGSTYGRRLRNVGMGGVRCTEVPVPWTALPFLLHSSLRTCKSRNISGVTGGSCQSPSRLTTKLRRHYRQLAYCLERQIRNVKAELHPGEATSGLSVMVPTHRGAASRPRRLLVGGLMQATSNGNGCKFKVDSWYLHVSSHTQAAKSPTANQCPHHASSGPGVRTLEFSIRGQQERNGAQQRVASLRKTRPDLMAMQRVSDKNNNISNGVITNMLIFIRGRPAGLSEERLSESH